MLDELRDMLVERLLLYEKKNKVLPERIFVYRDGVSEVGSSCRTGCCCSNSIFRFLGTIRHGLAGRARANHGGIQETGDERTEKQISP